jgi:predicted NodU family carbamoyl transferase
VARILGVSCYFHDAAAALVEDGVRRTVVAVAVARELAGHCWRLATME